MSHVLAIFSILGISSSYIFVELALSDLSPLMIATLRIIICTPLFYVLSETRPSIKKIKLNIVQLTCLSLLLVIMPNIFLNLGIKYSSGMAASFIEALEPMITTGLAALFLKERIKPHHYIGVCFALIGSYGFASKGFSINPFEQSSFLGIVFVFLSACSLAGSTVMGKKLMTIFSPVEVLFYTFFLSSILLIPMSVGTMKIYYYKIFNDYRVIIPVVGLSFISSMGGYILYFKSLNKMNAQTLSCYLFAIPIVTTLYSYIFLDILPKPFFYSSGSFIIIGLFIFEFFNPDKISDLVFNITQKQE